MINSLRFSCVPLTVSSALCWAAANVLSHQSNSKHQSKGIKNLTDNQYLFGASAFASVAASAFLNLYGGRTLIFAAASLWSLFMHLNKDNLPKNLLSFFDLGIVGFLGLAAASKGFIASKKATYHFPAINSFEHLCKAWKDNLIVEGRVAKNVFQNYSQILADIPRGLTAIAQNKQKFSLEGFQKTVQSQAPNFFQGNFQLTALMRLLAFATGGFALLKTQSKDSEEHKKNFWIETSSWLVSISLIPASLASLARNPKWDNISNTVFNLSSLFGIAGFSFKAISALANTFEGLFKSMGLNNFFKGELNNTIGSLCTKLLIVMQMLAYALSQCLGRKIR